VLLSGGLDSATVLALARAAGHEVYALSFAYGQRHAVEIDAAHRVATALGAARHDVITLDLRLWTGSALTGPVDVPKEHPDAPVETTSIPVTYVPARNIVFLSYGVGWAETVGAREVHIGVNAVDYSGYPDCRPEFVAAFQKTIDAGTRAGVEGDPIALKSPLISMTKAEIIRTGAVLGVDYGLTVSCYDPVGSLACGRCESCRLRRRGFADAGVADPTSYASRDSASGE
jgi:7-cyano-7-deazaguanine synthase